MLPLSVRSVLHQRTLIAGAFVAVLMGTALVAVTGRCLAAALAVHPRPGVDMGGIETILALAGVVSGFVTVFCVAGTSAFSVALRRRDLALLRLIGGGGGQIRRLVIGEALVTAVAAAIPGCLLGAVGTSAALDLLSDARLTPVPLHPPVSSVPLAIALGAGVLLALLGAAAAAVRAAGIAPAEALRESQLDLKVMTVTRWAAGAFMLAAGALMITLAALNGAEAATPLTVFGAMALAVAATTLAPAYLPRLAWLAAAPAGRLTGIPWQLAAAGIATARRRTASLAAPVIASVAIIGTLTAVLAAANAASAASSEQARLNQTVLLMMTVPAFVYALISIAGAQAMAYSARREEVTAMRLLGISRRQIRRMAVWESVIAVALGALLGLAVTAASLAAYHAALQRTYETTRLAVPWAAFVILAITCLATAVGSGLLAVSRPPPSGW
ncbi:MAG: FtsX-like permease family protein [Nocardiopsaceae bacterium]|jgi:putative ABC transport system permease protein|nr:FtsX-like permease family protein [Nocardiopsaceae bacterium]